MWRTSGKVRSASATVKILGVRHDQDQTIVIPANIFGVADEAHNPVVAVDHGDGRPQVRLAGVLVHFQARIPRDPDPDSRRNCRYASAHRPWYTAGRVPAARQRVTRSRSLSTPRKRRVRWSSTTGTTEILRLRNMIATSLADALATATKGFGTITSEARIARIRLIGKFRICSPSRRNQARQRLAGPPHDPPPRSAGSGRARKVAPRSAGGRM